MARMLSRLVSISLAVLILISPLTSANSHLSDYELKAVLIYKLAKFVTWPEEEFDHFEICVFGQNPFGNALDNIEDKLINNKPISIRYTSRISKDLENCQLLFVTNTSSSHLNRILLTTSYSPTLTISDLNNFANFGGMIELRNVNQQIKFLINVKAAKAVDLEIASPLLELSTIVGGN